MAKLKICANCKHSGGFARSAAPVAGTHPCFRGAQVSLVTGSMIASRTCEEERSDLPMVIAGRLPRPATDRCGPEGKYYEEAT